MQSTMEGADDLKLIQYHSISTRGGDGFEMDDQKSQIDNISRANATKTSILANTKKVNLHQNQAPPA